MKKLFTKDAISTSTRKLTLARQTLRHLTSRELTGIAGGEEPAKPPPVFGQPTWTCVTCTSD